jgi:hypothetical protein
MTLSRIVAVALLVVPVSMSAAFQPPRVHPAAPPDAVTISGTIRDASGNPIAGAVVHSGSYYSLRNGTTPNGKYTLTLPGNRPTSITVEDFAFESVTTTITPTKDAVFDFTLNVPRPKVTVKLTSGETHIVDLGTSQFAYLVPLSGYVRADTGNFCKPDGSVFAPAKTDFSRIVGPATSVNFSACCTRGPVATVTAELKSGERTPLYFNDSCFGYEVDFIGRELSTGQFGFFNFANIAEIDFP